MTDKEIALEQALLALVAEAIELGVGATLVDKASAGLIGNAKYRSVDHPYLGTAVEAIKQAEVSWRKLCVYADEN